MAKVMSKSELVQTIAELHSDKLKRADVKDVIESLAAVGYKELKKTGAFLVPGLAKFVVIKKPATKARKGINPFTKEPTMFKAKPARGARCRPDASGLHTTAERAHASVGSRSVGENRRMRAIR
jgi:DNA-binding protein HU-beta